jgi:acetyl esterase/lipase
LPGGAFGVLAWDVEGTEVGEYLAGLGITAFVLKYRVRAPTAKMWLSLPFRGLEGVMAPGREAASLDAMQAVRFVRANAGRFEIDPDRVGMMGFSAGAITLFRVLQDAEPGARPDIVASIYGMMFDEGVRPEATPLFIAVARDDESVQQSEAINAYWQRAGAPSELHVFETGGHGFGLGRPGTDSAAFASVFEIWLRAQRFISMER